MSALDILTAAPRWLAWRNELVKDKLSKIPYVTPTRKASSTNPSTWRVRPEAEACAKTIVNGRGGGVGIVLGDLGDNLYLCGLDLDSCLHDDTIAPWATAILDVIKSYVEISPSGGGLKGFFYVESGNIRWFLDRIGVEKNNWGCKRGIPGEDSSDHGPAVEFYTASRFFAVTDRQWPDAPHDSYPRRI